MKQLKIYEIEINYSNNIVGIRPSEPTFTYFSNLSLVIENIQKNLAIKSWDEHNINYTAVYRSLKSKKAFVSEIKFKGVKIFKISIREKILNPALSNLGIEERPN
jgi:hypothetical protein